MAENRPTEWIRICAVEDVPRGSAIAADIDGTPVAIVHTGEGEEGCTDAFHAIHDVCSHAEIALSEGEVDGCTLECWLHGSRFDLKTGIPTGLPAIEPVATFSVEIRDGDIFV